MSLPFFTDLPGIAAELQRFLITHAAALPEAARENLITFGGHPSPVDRIVKSAEALYAVRDELPEAALDMAAQLAQFAALNGWHEMSARGMAIAAALQRQAGHEPPGGTSWPDPADDPEPSSEFIPPAPEAEATA